MKELKKRLEYLEDMVHHCKVIDPLLAVASSLEDPL